MRAATLALSVILLAHAICLAYRVRKMEDLPVAILEAGIAVVLIAMHLGA